MVMSPETEKYISVTRRPRSGKKVKGAFLKEDYKESK